MANGMPTVDACTNCATTNTHWIACDDCVGYETHPHEFLACADCHLTSIPFTERGWL